MTKYYNKKQLREEAIKLFDRFPESAEIIMDFIRNLKE